MRSSALIQRFSYAERQELKKNRKRVTLNRSMDKVLHEIWEDTEGLPGLVVAGEQSEAARKLFQEEGSKLVHTFYASSFYEAMTIYYAYYEWGEYTTIYEYDKLPYSEWEKIKGRPRSEFVPDDL